LILETLTGATLAYLIDNNRRRVPLSDVIHLGLHLCSAIHYLHRHGILYLDLKPSNIVSKRQLAKVLDLSVARQPGKGVKGIGTANYMSPEQARGDLLGPAADVWGIGTVLFEVAAGEEAFDAYEDETRYEQLERRAESIRSHRRVPAAFAVAVDACLEPDPAERPTVKDLTQTLNELVQARSS
jgi:serine/threonine protein kinase